MALFGWLKPKTTLPPPRLRLVVYATEETLPIPLQLAHPDALWGALEGTPVALRQRLDPRLLVEQSMEPGNYLFKGPHGEVLACVEQRYRGTAYPGRDRQRPGGTPQGLGLVERNRLESARWTITFELTEVAAEVRDAVLYQMGLADRLAMLAEGIVFDQEANRYFLPGKWQVANALKPVDVREHVSLHMEPYEGETLWVHTHGLIKFGRPELEIFGVSEAQRDPACHLMVDLCQRLVSGAVLRPGETVGDPDSPLFVRAGRGGLPLHDGPSLELVDMSHDGKAVARGGAPIAAGDGSSPGRKAANAR